MRRLLPARSRSCMALSAIVSLSSPLFWSSVRPAYGATFNAAWVATAACLQAWRPSCRRAGRHWGLP
eukprot:574898-Pyramimonas_sp.AAC.1